MPEFTGRLRLTRLQAHPANPQPGEVYFNTTDDQIYLWNGVEWRASDIPGPEGPPGPPGPPPEPGEALQLPFIFTDQIAEPPAEGEIRVNSSYENGWNNGTVGWFSKRATDDSDVSNVLLGAIPGQVFFIELPPGYARFIVFQWPVDKGEYVEIPGVIEELSPEHADYGPATLTPINSGLPGAQGPIGPAGADGAFGPPGPPGADSTVPGPPGSQGPSGAAGADGAQGPKGDKGDTGTQGTPGTQGPQGVKGDTGSTGSQGPAGAPGLSFEFNALSAYNADPDTTPPAAGQLQAGGSLLAPSALLLADTDANGIAVRDYFRLAYYSTATVAVQEIGTIHTWPLRVTGMSMGTGYVRLNVEPYSNAWAASFPNARVRLAFTPAPSLPVIGSSAYGAVVARGDTEYDIQFKTLTFRTGESWVVPGALTAITLPPIFVPEATAIGQAVKLISVRAQILSGTSIVAQMQRNGTNLGAAITVTTTPATTAFNQAITDLDRLGVVLSTPTGSPVGLSLTAILEHTL